MIGWIVSWIVISELFFILFLKIGVWDDHWSFKKFVSFLLTGIIFLFISELIIIITLEVFIRWTITTALISFGLFLFFYLNYLLAKKIGDEE